MAAAEVEPASTPPLICRWLHGGPQLDELTSMPLAQAAKADGNAPPSVWRSFTDEEDQRLEAAWNKLDEDARERAWRAKIRGSGSGKSSAASSRRTSSVERPKDKPVPDPVDEADTQEEVVEEETQKGYLADMERESMSHIVHVSQDRLFSADLLSLSLYPVFWKGARIGVQRATWFYPSSTQNKFYPVDALLAYHLEEAYEEIKPYAASYADELKSAIEIGSEGEAKLKHNMMEVGVDVIYQSADSAKIYARNLPSRLSKTFLTSFLRDKAHSGGGTLVYRGYDTVLKHMSKSKATKAEAAAKEKKDALKTKASINQLKATQGAAEAEPNAAEKAEDPKATQKAGSRLGNMFSFSYSSSGKKGGSDVQDNVESADENTTAEAMEGSKGEGDSNGEPELAELCICVHGIGQKLATTYESFSIVHAINALRKLCNKQARDPAITDIVGSKRIQFIPLQWRSSLQLEDMDDESDSDRHLDNRFTLDDIQVEGAIPFVRSLVTGVALDCAFYLSHHRERMTATVVRDANRIYRLFKQRNPGFKGKVSIIAHSLGTALATDILSNQPTWVTEPEHIDPNRPIDTKHFEFNVSSLFFLGSPVGYMFFLNRGQLIARSGRERTKTVDKAIALDKAGRYGCMAIDSLYNVYNVVDPVACTLNATVDADYAKIVKPVAINSVTTSMLSDYASKATSFISSLIPSLPSFGGGGAKAATDTDASQGIPVSEKPEEPPQRPSLKRPKTKRQFTSELDVAGLKRFNRAEQRMLALNPQGSIDFYMPAEGFSQYYDMLLSHASYWHDIRFATFLVTQLLASPERLNKAKKKREEEEERAEAEHHMHDTKEAAKQ